MANYAAKTNAPPARAKADAVRTSAMAQAHTGATAQTAQNGWQGLQDLANNSPACTRLQNVSAMAQNSQQAIQLHAWDAMMNASVLQAQSGTASLAQSGNQSNYSGLPDNLKSGIEALSGISMHHVRVHYNSSRPAQLHALAYAQGNDIHVAPGQERHLPHEAWHVVQQAQGRVQPTVQMKGGLAVNDDARLEHEADVMGAQALRAGSVAVRADSARAGDAGATQAASQLAAAGAPGLAAPLQLRIDQTLAQHAGIAGVTRQTVEAYRAFINAEFQNALARFGDDYDMPVRRALVDMNVRYLLAYANARRGGNWDAVAVPMNELVVAINECLEFSGRNDNFSNGREDSWANAGTGINAMQGVVDAHQLGVMVPKRQRGPLQHPNAPRIGWRHASAVMPSAQKDLVLAIYLSWKYGKVFDQRNEDEKAVKTKNSSTAGALRSWHMNEQAQLPDIADVAVPDRAQKLHDHYTKNSMKPYDEPAAGPIGYAEYTGTGILNDAHYSKIVLDYKSGLVYMTLSHYGLWNLPTLQNPQPVIGGKGAGSGSQSAWFCIDMTQ